MYQLSNRFFEVFLSLIFRVRMTDVCNILFVCIICYIVRLPVTQLCQQTLPCPTHLASSAMPVGCCACRSPGVTEVLFGRYDDVANNGAAETDSDRRSCPLRAQVLTGMSSALAAAFLWTAAPDGTGLRSLLDVA